MGPLKVSLLPNGALYPTVSIGVEAPLALLMIVPEPVRVVKLAF